MKNIFLIVFLLLINSCKSQNSTIMIPTVDNKFEKFDEIIYKKNKTTQSSSVSINLPDGKYIEMINVNSGAAYYETAKDSYFTIVKDFYKNFNIKFKGVGINSNPLGYKKGIWYEFDESGKLIKEIDYDKPFKFTFEDILKFCEKENITVEKGPILQSTGWHTTISRGLENNHPYWSIEWLKKPDVLEKITLDGITGKVVSRTERQYINN